MQDWRLFYKQIFLISRLLYKQNQRHLLVKFIKLVFWKIDFINVLVHSSFTFNCLSTFLHFNILYREINFLFRFWKYTEASLSRYLKICANFFWILHEENLLNCCHFIVLFVSKYLRRFPNMLMLFCFLALKLLICDKIICWYHQHFVTLIFF